MTKFRFTTDPIEKKPDVVLRGGVETEGATLRFYLEDDRGNRYSVVRVTDYGRVVTYPGLLASLGIVLD